MRLLFVIVWLVATLTIQVQAGDEGWKELLAKYVERDWQQAASDPIFADRARELDSSWIESSSRLAMSRKPDNNRSAWAIHEYNNLLPPKIRLDEASLKELQPYFWDLWLNFDADSHDPDQVKVLSHARYLLLLAYLDEMQKAINAGKAMDRTEFASTAFQAADDYINRHIWTSGKGLLGAYKLRGYLYAKLDKYSKKPFFPTMVEHFRLHRAAIKSTALERWRYHFNTQGSASHGNIKTYKELVERRRKASNGDSDAPKGPLTVSFVNEYSHLPQPVYMRESGLQEQEMVKDLMPSFLEAAAEHPDDYVAHPTLVGNILQHTKPSGQVLEWINGVLGATPPAAARTDPASRNRKGKSIVRETGDTAFRHDADPTQQPVYDQSLPTKNFQHADPNPNYHPSQLYDTFQHYDFGQLHHTSQPHSTRHPQPPPLGAFGRLLFETDDHPGPTSSPPTHRADPHPAVPTVPTDNAANILPLSSPRSPVRRVRKSARTLDGSGSKDAPQSVRSEEMRDASRDSDGSRSRQSRRRRPVLEETAESMPAWHNQRDAQLVEGRPADPHQGYGATGWPGYQGVHPQPAYGAPAYGAPQYGPPPQPHAYGPPPGHHPGYAPPLHAYPNQPYYAHHYPPVHYAPAPPPFAHYAVPPPMSHPSYPYTASTYPRPYPAGSQAYSKPSAQQGSSESDGATSAFDDS